MNANTELTAARESSLRLASLLRREHEAMADFLLALADFDRQRHWVHLGHSCLFNFLHRDLGMSRSAAFFRKTTAELVQKYPEIIAPLRDGRVCISSVAEIAKVITPENRDEVLPRFFHRSNREAKAIAAELAPMESPPRREVVTVVPVQVAPTSAATAARVPAEPPQVDDDVARDDRAAAAADSGDCLWSSSSRRELNDRHQDDVTREHVEPLTADLRRLHVTVSKRFMDKLERAKTALSHSRPGANADEVLEAALDLLLERDAKRKGLVQKPRAGKAGIASQDDRSQASTSAEPSKYIPAHVKRAVWNRDGGRCQWPVETGGICGSTTRIEFDHIRPRKLGGPSTIDNVRTLCKFHNDLAARHALGSSLMDLFTNRHTPSGSPTRGASPQANRSPTADGARAGLRLSPVAKS